MSSGTSWLLQTPSHPRRLNQWPIGLRHPRVLVSAIVEYQKVVLSQISEYSGGPWTEVPLLSFLTSTRLPRQNVPKNVRVVSLWCFASSAHFNLLLYISSGILLISIHAQHYLFDSIWNRCLDASRLSPCTAGFTCPSFCHFTVPERVPHGTHTSDADDVAA